MLVLAKPFMVKVFDINSQIISAPAAEEGGIYQKGGPKGGNPFCDQVLPTGRVGVYQIISGLYKDYRFDDAAFPAQMSRRGLAGEALAKVAFPYRDDGRIWWDAIKDFVGEIVRATYANDAAVAADAGLAAWMSKVRAAFNHDGVTRFSYLPTIDGVEAIFTNLLFLCSVQHTAVNNTMFPSWAFTPNGAFAMQAAPPRDAASVTQATVLGSLPDPHSGALDELIVKQIYFVMSATPIVTGTLGVDPRSADRMEAVYPHAPGSAQAAAVGRFWDAIWTGDTSVSARIKQNQEARVRSWRGGTPTPNSLAYRYLSPGLVAFAPPSYLNAPVMNAIQV